MPGRAECVVHSALSSFSTARSGSRCGHLGSSCGSWRWLTGLGCGRRTALGTPVERNPNVGGGNGSFYRDVTLIKRRLLV